MLDCFVPPEERDESVTPIILLKINELGSWLAGQSERVNNWVELNGFLAKAGQCCCVPTELGELDLVLLGCDDTSSGWMFFGVSSKLPEGVYQIDESSCPWGSAQNELMALAWGLGAYRFNAYRDHPSSLAQLAIPTDVDSIQLEHWLSSLYLAQDLVNTPCQDMGPQDLQEAVMHVAKECGAELSVIEGDQLLTDNYPAIHAVGRAAKQAPRLIDLTWGDESAPKITLVGKGVCFDTGGLDLKGAAHMRGMKADMGGAAAVLALARVIMLQAWPVRLRLMIPAVENNVSSDSYRPDDVITTRKGVTVEVHNTDAEGRLVLCDALAEACQEHPDYLIDMATLTGAKVVALGADMPMVTGNDRSQVFEFQELSWAMHDPVWSLPLHRPYNALLKSSIADCTNCASKPQAGSITAALFLDKFVDEDVTWFHLDIAGCERPEVAPGCLIGPSAFGVRALFSFLKKKVIDNH